MVSNVNVDNCYGRGAAMMIYIFHSYFIYLVVSFAKALRFDSYLSFAIGQLGMVVVCTIFSLSVGRLFKEKLPCLGSFFLGWR